MNEGQIEITIPHLFRCPISLDLFEDPVTLCTGQTYDRSSIEKWFSAGNLTCPVTMQKLRDPSIVPNHTLRHLIDQWLQLGHQFHHQGNSATIDYLASLKHTLESPQLENKLQALEKIRALSDEYCSFRKSCFHQLSFLPLLLELVFGTHLSKSHMEFTELALSCILKLLPLVSLEPLSMIKDESKLATFLVLFEKGTISVKTSLCHLVDSTAAPQTEEVCHMLGHSQKLVHEIVVLVSQSCEASKVAIKALLALCSLQSNRENLVRGGAIDGVITYISGCETRQKNLAPLAMAIIKKLLVLESAKEALVNHPKGVETLVKMVFRVCNQECSESAVGILSIICGDFGRAREEAIGAGVLTQLLFLLQSQCGTKTKTKARMLLKLLRSKWIEEPKHV
ncbi:U-box domain-containing protein 25 [Cajanus cajan]|uniref:U-box domain-containing protein n=1 Tax=Cajanus cajan TaxID=3821 RepID=A0A151ST43_CAJCA|nr:U-box domain-containing protein 25 [Cajanus cajan]KYP57938.1 U-box domain-containing protein 25 [Cajanus cajan]